jgi:2-polyprenyl-3-methyl-5-hydroxy-6-metoxy-1,4-benzoquinol methylase
MSEVLWRRLGYMLSPQLDIYKSLDGWVEGKDVLDIGFGTGFGTLQFIALARSVSGIELDREAVAFAQHCIPGIDWQWGDISRPISYFQKEYDVILMIEVLEHVQDWQAALKNVREVLRPGGKIIISARNAFADLRKNDLHEREWTAKEFSESLGRYFTNVRLYDYRLENELDISTRQTPLVAIAQKG